MASFRRLLGALGVAALTATTSVAGADEPSGQPPPSLKFEVTPSSAGPWILRITNTGATPVRLAADARLVSLDVGTARCMLPDDARPSTDEGKELVVPAQRSWSASFDPLFYCFGAKERAALTAGATVHAHFGWPASGKKAASPPFAVSPVGASVGTVRPEKMIDADAFVLKEAVVGATPPPAPQPAPANAEGERASLSLPATMDAARGTELTTTVTFHNESDRPLTLMFRPDMVQFTVHGPEGTVSCGSVKSIDAPIRELFVTVGAKSHTALAVLFTSTCAPGTFDQPGLYHVEARLDTRHASGRLVNVRSWDDVATTREPMLLRVREPRRPGPGRKPLLD